MGFLDIFRRKKKKTALEWYNERKETLLNEFPFLRNNPYEYRKMEDAELKRRAQIINESDEIIDTSKNQDTRISRCELCIKMLFEICACFPIERQYAVALSNALDAYEKIKRGGLPSVPKSRHLKNKGEITFDDICKILDEGKENVPFPRTANVDGIPIYEYAETHKHDYAMMFRCCQAELKESQRSKTIPAPFYFWRCAVLAKKAKRYDIEVQVCQSYLGFVDRYTAEMRSKGKRLGYDCTDIGQSPRVADMRKRLPKALSNLEKSKAITK